MHEHQPGTLVVDLVEGLLAHGDQGQARLGAEALLFGQLMDLLHPGQSRCVLDVNYIPPATTTTLTRCVIGSLGGEAPMNRV